MFSTVAKKTPVCVSNPSQIKDDSYKPHTDKTILKLMADIRQKIKVWLETFIVC